MDFYNMKDFSGLMKHFYEDTQKVSCVMHSAFIIAACWYTVWFLIKLNFYLWKGEESCSPVGLEYTKGIKGATYVCLHWSVKLSLAQSLPRHGIQAAPRGSGAAWLLCRHIFLPVHGPAPLSSWSELMTYFQLPAAGEVCPSFQVPVRAVWNKPWAMWDCISRICRFPVPVRQGRQGNNVLKSLGWSESFLWMFFKLWFWNILCFLMQIQWYLENGNTLKTFVLKSDVLKVNRMQIWSSCRGNESVNLFCC